MVEYDETEDDTGYYDEQGEWHYHEGYYDEDGNWQYHDENWKEGDEEWHDTNEGWYDEHGQWHDNAEGHGAEGWYDEHGEWHDGDGGWQEGGHYAAAPEEGVAEVVEYDDEVDDEDVEFGTGTGEGMVGVVDAAAVL